MSQPAEDVVLYRTHNRVATVTMNRPRYRNAQNQAMTRALDAAFRRAVADDEVGAIVLAGAGSHFSGGHDIGTPERDIRDASPNLATVIYDHVGKPEVESIYARELDVYLEVCRRWRELPKPVIASVQGACIAGGLALAWGWDLIVASDDAYFSDPVVGMSMPGIEYFAHPFALPPRIAREMLFTGDGVKAERAYQLGMVNHVVPAAELADKTQALAEKIASKPRFALALAKRSINQAEDQMGLRDAIDGVYGYHQLAHAARGDALGGFKAS
jgi:enoyl-CoA hydratase